MTLTCCVQAVTTVAEHEYIIQAILFDSSGQSVRDVALTSLSR